MDFVPGLEGDSGEDTEKPDLLDAFSIEEFGYVAPFWIAGVLFLLFSITAWRTLKPQE